MTRARAALAICFVLALLPMLASQAVRLRLADPVAWLLCDYAGRFGTLAVLAAIPMARRIAFARGQATLDAGAIVIRIILLALFYFFVVRLLSAALNYYHPAWHRGTYPALHGWIYWFDLTLGLLLVALSEEVLFRRMARAALGALLGDGWTMVAASAIMFGAFHWWTGVWNVAAATVLGGLFMLLYRRSPVLWPVIAIHYIVDVIAFA